MKNLLLALVALLILGVGAWAWKTFFSARKDIREEATVLLEKIHLVSQLITVEGQFSEIYSHSEYEGAFTWLWEKKALLRVKAKVLAGFDLNQMQLTSHPQTRTIEMSALPEPKILSIDHTIDYYDISNGIFTTFTPADYNLIHQRSKNFIREKAEQSPLLPAAREQGKKMMELIRFMVESAGWKLVIVDTPRPVEPHR